MDVVALTARAADAYNASHALARDVLAHHLAIHDVNAAHALVVIVTLLAVLIAFRVVFGVGGAFASLASGSHSRSKTQKPAVLLLGGKGCGKTALWQSFKYGEQRFRTTTSIEANECGDAVVVGKNSRGREVTKSHVRIVDVPGHPKLRSDALRELARAQAVVFVVDSVSFAGERKEVAKFLFDILSDEAFQTRKIPLMIACNKCEKLTAHPPDFIRKRLEREIDAARIADAGALPDMAITAAQRRANAAMKKKRDKYRALGQRSGETFTFDAFTKALRRPSVVCERVSAMKNQLAPLRDFVVRVT
jgi:signal recognition particle receptor subunit beta